jgi:hypothetical protein
MALVSGSMVRESWTKVSGPSAAAMVVVCLLYVDWIIEVVVSEGGVFVQSCWSMVCIADCTLVGVDDSYHMQMNEYCITLDNNGSSDTPDDGGLTKALSINKQTERTLEIIVSDIVHPFHHLSLGLNPCRAND